MFPADGGWTAALHATDVTWRVSGGASALHRQPPAGIQRSIIDATATSIPGPCVRLRVAPSK
jgi:hypothetical protein